MKMLAALGRVVGLLPLAVLAALVTGCQTVQTTQGGVVGVEREQRMMVSANEMVSASAQSYQKILQEARQKNALNRDPAQVERVRNVARRLIPGTGAFRPDAPSWKWEVNVLSSNELNAWCMAGGKIAFYSGIIERLDLSDDEIAAIMGHEIAHALREHARERASQAMVTNIGVSIVGAVLGNILLIMGIGMFAGGWKREKQTFNQTAVSSQALMLFLATHAKASHAHSR